MHTTSVPEKCNKATCPHLNIWTENMNIITQWKILLQLQRTLFTEDIFEFIQDLHLSLNYLVTYIHTWAALAFVNLSMNETESLLYWCIWIHLISVQSKAMRHSGWCMYVILHTAVLWLCTYTHNLQEFLSSIVIVIRFSPSLITVSFVVEQ